MKSVEAILATMSDACLRSDAPEKLASDARGYLEGHELAAEDADALLAASPRLALYRKLVRHNVVNVIDSLLSKTKASFEAAAPGVFAASVDAFLDAVGSQSHHLRDVPGELVAWAAPRWRNEPALPRWLVDYASFELADFTVGIAPRREVVSELVDVAADRPLVFAEPARVIHFAFAVHRMADEDVAPAEAPTSLFFYRDDEHRTRTLELSPLAAAILERLLAGDTLGLAMTAACQTVGMPLDDTVLAGAAQLLADLGERGVLLGARA